MSKLRETIFGSQHPKAGQHHSWLFWCPGCNEPHHLTDAWTFNNDHERPTFTPSLLVHGLPSHHPRCHSFITAGRIEFLGDCEHALRLQTVDIPEWPRPDWGGLK